VNTPFIIGVVVYTGTDTKLVLNQQPVPLKFSYVERITNKLLIALIAFILCLCLITAVLSVYWRVRSSPSPRLLFFIFFFFLLLF
jgi:phospholipid-translocating ATPase